VHRDCMFRLGGMHRQCAEQSGEQAEPRQTSQ
jgi:hypothetical protein